MISQQSRLVLKVLAGAAAVTFALSSVALLPSCSGSSASAAEGPHFEYSGDSGPAFWGSLDPAWVGCDAVGDQSPVDIATTVPDAALAPLNVVLNDTPIHLINNGHTIEQEYESGSHLTVDSQQFELLQFHFHTLSEHTVGGERFPLELHAVFRNEESGQLAVIGVLYEVGGAENTFLASLLTAGLPQQCGEVVTNATMINLSDAFVDTASYYRYAGSLTTPPCSPIVTWTVLRNRATMTQAQADAFRRVLGNNFRPLQAIGSRTITETSQVK